MRREKQKRRVGKVLLEHIHRNAKEYLLVGILFLIGIVAGIIFINNAKEVTQSEITNYIYNFTDTLKNNQEIDQSALLKEAVTENILLGIVLWFVGSTIIGIPIVYAIVVYRGFCIRLYGISSTSSFRN